VRLTLVRHATLLLDMAGVRLLVDPMLDPAGARSPIPGTPEPRRNPLVELPRPAEDVVRGVAATIITHLHEDHIDAAALGTLPADMPIVCQPEEVAELQGTGRAELVPLAGEVDLGPVRVVRTPGRHGHGQLGEALGPVSGVVLRAEGEPTVYVAGDTVWCEEVATTLRETRPEVVVVNAGGARFVQGEPVTMDADDVVATARAAPDAILVAVHMEAINHCLLDRAALGERLAAEGLAERVLIPPDGGALEITSAE
jgi:L-ascorbate metabolism protein UlaG (beta-lactamase superfamily)